MASAVSHMQTLRHMKVISTMESVRERESTPTSMEVFTRVIGSMISLMEKENAPTLIVSS